MSMRIIEINSVNHGSTGTIMRNIAIEAEKSGIDATICFQKARSTAEEKYQKVIRIGNRIDRNIHLQLGKLTGKYGLFSKLQTKIFIKKIDKMQPDLIHLHNLHKGYINIDILFKYIKRKEIPVIWTLHDCWSFTGQCPYFDRVHCNRWKNEECGKCPQYKQYPALIDNTHFMYKKKKAYFTGVKKMVLVTPSNWLANLTRESFLSEYSVKVIPNGIDLNIFRPRESNIRDVLLIKDKIVILGVASIWDQRKRLDVFLRLSDNLPKDLYQIIVIGLSDIQIAQLPDNIIGLKKTKNAIELAEYYSSADLFLNPTVEDNFPTVNIEALACGTPVYTFNTGGSAECILNDKCGKIVDEKNLLNELLVFSEKNYSQEACISAASHFSATDKFREYIDLYKSVLEN